MDEPFKDLAIGHSTPTDAGTKGKFIEFRVWNHERSEEEIRSTFSRSFKGAAELPKGLTHYYPHGADPNSLHGDASILSIAEAPALRDEAAAAEEARVKELAKVRMTSVRVKSIHEQQTAEKKKAEDAKKAKKKSSIDSPPGIRAEIAITTPASWLWVK